MSGGSLKYNLRLIGRLPTAGSALVIALVLTFNATLWRNAPFLATARAIETFVPLAAGLQAAFLLSPEDEPPLELLLAYPRPLAWTLVERLTMAAAMLGGVALAGNLAGLTFPGSEGLPLALARWAAPSVCLTGVALFTTELTRQGTFGALLSTLLWGGMLFGGDPLLTRWPFLWPLHAYLQPEAVSPAVYALNRVTLALAGLALIALAVHLTHDEEHMLGIRRVGRKG